MSVLSMANEQLKCSPKPPKILEIFTHISQIKIYFGKLREIFVYRLFLRKNLSQLFEIRFYLLVIFISKTCVKQVNSKIQKLGLRDEFDYPNI
jgi:hypothetical protein